jgi:2-C-methyl-D-erythritol 4-phosphate cytidylyltransferase
LTFALLMPAAGSGTRLGAKLPKSLVEIAGKPMFVHAALPFVTHRLCVEAVVAAPIGFERQYATIAQEHFPGRRIRVVAGGKTRQESVAAALKSLTSEAEIVLIHDAARPLVTVALIERVLDALTDKYAAVVPGLPITDTLKRVSGNPQVVAETADRAGLIAVQTPQAMRRKMAEEAHRAAAREEFSSTDDVSLVEHFHLGKVRVVPGDPRDLKVTNEQDLALARELLEARLETIGTH